jgi:hypothetical protein
MATDADKEVNNLVVTLSSFIRDVVTTNVAEAKQKGLIKIDDSEVRKVISITASSIEQALSKAHGQIEGTKRALREGRGR